MRKIPKHGNSIPRAPKTREGLRRWSDDALDMIFRLAAEGYTQEEIGKVCGVSRQRIAQVMGGRGRTYNQVRPRSIYRGLNEWMLQNDITCATLTSMMGYASNASQQNVVKRRIMGVTELRMRDINRLIELSGKTYEYLFSSVLREGENDS